MKLAIAIISNKDVSNVISATSTEGFQSTKVATQGQFLQTGQTTILYGVEDDKVNTLMKIIEDNTTNRMLKQSSVESTIEGSLLKTPVDVEEYGAVIFVINVEEFKKL